MQSAQVSDEASKPTESARCVGEGYFESFSRGVHDECLNINLFWFLTQERVIISDWKAEYILPLKAFRSGLPDRGRWINS